MLNLLPFILMAVLALSVLILIHELGHFLAAKLSGVWVEEFGIGLPPRLWGKKYGETIYSVNWLPIGGFVRLHGEDPSSRVTKKARSYQNKSPFARIFIAVAGVLMNYLLAVICFAVIFWFTGIPRDISVIDLSPGSPAQIAGLKPGDEIIAVNGRKTTGYLGYSNFIYYINESIGKEINFEILRSQNGSSESLSFNVLARAEAPDTQGPTGIIYSPKEVYFPSLIERPFVYGYYGIVKTHDFSLKIIHGFRSIFEQLLIGRVPAGVAGPVGVTTIFTEIARMGILPIIEFSGIISINLALLNLVPFPPLDGSRVMFILLEILTRKRVTPKIESWSYSVGMAILLMLMLVLTAREIPQLISAGSLSGFVDLLLQSQ